MTPLPDTRQALWRRIAEADTADASAPSLSIADSGLRDRLDKHASPALAAFLTGETDDRPAVRASRLSNRFTCATQGKWIARIREAGFETVCLKGFAHAHLLYPEPDRRTVGDLDILIRERDLVDLVEFLKAAGFAFHLSDMARWGFISDASFAPLVSEDDGCNIDIHIGPDAFPVHRSLTTDDVFAAARTLETDHGDIRVPSPEHCFLLLASNAAKDKFGPFSVRKSIDALRLMRQSDLDWTAMAQIAKAGRFLKPFAAFAALLSACADDQAFPKGFPDTLADGIQRLTSGPVSGPVFRRLAADYADLFPHPPGGRLAAIREIALGAEWPTVRHNAVARARGLIRPSSGEPELADWASVRRAGAAHPTARVPKGATKHVATPQADSG